MLTLQRYGRGWGVCGSEGRWVPGARARARRVVGRIPRPLGRDRHLSASADDRGSGGRCGHAKAEDNNFLGSIQPCEKLPRSRLPKYRLSRKSGIGSLKQARGCRQRADVKV
jgi:hypothetical protein